MQCLHIYQLVDQLRNLAELRCIAFFCSMYYFHYTAFTYLHTVGYTATSEKHKYCTFNQIHQVALHLTFFWFSQQALGFAEGCT